MIPVTAAELTHVFSRVGPVTNVHCPAVGSYAFVDFERHDDAARAITTLDGQDVKGSAMKLSWGQQGSRKQTKAQQQQSTADAAAIAEAAADPDNTRGNLLYYLKLFFLFVLLDNLYSFGHTEHCIR
jgi:nucleolysin TIA-1/TIAR